MASSAGAAVVGATGGFFTGDLGHNGLVNAVHQFVNNCLGAVEFCKSFVVHDQIVKLVDAALDALDQIHIAILLGNCLLHSSLLNVVFNKIAFFEGCEEDVGKFVNVTVERADAFALYGKKQ